MLDHIRSIPSLLRMQFMREREKRRHYEEWEREVDTSYSSHLSPVRQEEPRERHQHLFTSDLASWLTIRGTSHTRSRKYGLDAGWGLHSSVQQQQWSSVRGHRSRPVKTTQSASTVLVAAECHLLWALKCQPKNWPVLELEFNTSSSVFLLFYFVYLLILAGGLF